MASDVRFSVDALKQKSRGFPPSCQGFRLVTAGQIPEFWSLPPQKQLQPAAQRARMRWR